MIAAASILFVFSIIFFYLKFQLQVNEYPTFLVAIVFKVFAGLTLGFLYLQYFGGGDATVYFSEAQKINNNRKQVDCSIWEFIAEAENSDSIYEALVFKHEPRSLFFTKVTYLFFVVAGGNFWMINVFFSLMSFSGFWFFYQTLRKLFDISQTTLMLALFLWPSVVFWSSGLVKESISTPLILTIIASVLWLMNSKKNRFLFLLIIVVSSYLLFHIRYYYAAVLIPLLISLAVSEFLKKRTSIFNGRIYRQLVFFFFLLFVLTWIASNLHYNLHLENVIRVITDNYYLFKAKSDPEKMVEFEGLTPSAWSLLYHSPKALFSGLFRPHVFDIVNVWSAIAAVENLLLLILCVFQLKNLKNIKGASFLMLFTAVVYCCVMAVILSFSAPNLGTLVRYKAGFLPIMLVVVLCNNPLLKKVKNKF